MNTPPTDPEKAEPEAGSIDISHLDIYQLLELFIMLLSEQVRRYLGPRVDPRTNEAKKDFDRAHVAIDCIISLVDKMEPNLASKDKDRLRSLITDLQIEYAQQMK